MGDSIQEFLAKEYADNDFPLQKVSIICEYYKGSFLYKDISLEERQIDPQKEFVEQIILPYRYVKNAKNMDVAFDNFISDIMDYEESYNKSIVGEYTNKGEEPVFANVTGIEVPVLYKNKKLPKNQQADQIIEDALELYEIIQQNIIESQSQSINSTHNDKEISTIIEEAKANFYEKRRGDLLKVAAGFSLFGILAFGGKALGNKEKKADRKLPQTAQIQEVNAPTTDSEKTISYEAARIIRPQAKNEAKKVDVKEKGKEVRAKLVAKSTPKPEPKKAQTQAPQAKKDVQKHRFEVEKITNTAISPLAVAPSIDISKIDIPKLIETNKQQRFNKTVDETFNREGGLASTEEDAKKLRAEGKKVSVIDQRTNFGVIEATLAGFKKQFPNDAKGFPESVKDLTDVQAKKIIEKAFYEQFHTNKIENESIALMIFDASYNHKPKTFIKFINSAIKEVEKGRTDKTKNKDINTMSKRVAYINNCNNKELKVFYDKFAKERLAFMKDGRVKKFKGIITRAEGYIGGFKSDSTLNQAISVEHVMKIIKNNKENTIHFAAVTDKKTRG